MTISYLKPDITLKQRKNLETLARFLERRIEPPKFSMNTYLKIDFGNKFLHADGMKEAVEAIADFLNTDANENTVYNYCGTVACAIGHGPLAGIKIKKKEDWQEYAVRVFIDDNLSSDNFKIWQYLFVGSWAGIDNTPKGAAARIWLVLDKGMPYDPLSWTDYKADPELYKSYKKGKKNHPDKKKVPDVVMAT